MRIMLKDGKEHEIPNEWIEAWEGLYYHVKKELLIAIQWSLDHAENRKTRRGLRGFLGNWIRRKCPMKPVERPKAIEEQRPPVQPLDVRKAHLAVLKGALK